jgi:glycerol transport system ATP-binding protein
MLEVLGVSRRVGAEVHLNDISLRLPRGTLNVLLGPTLAGKTSLMRLMAGLDKPTSGFLLFDGKDVTGMSVQRRNVAMVYQQFINYPTLTVRENIASPLRVKGMANAAVLREVRRVAELLRLESYLDRKPSELSGGQQQRVSLARALVKKAGLILLDEPLANLDYKLREELRAELPKLFAATDSVVVYATTDPAEALLLGGATATMWEGRVTQFGPAPTVYRHPEDLVTARIFSDPPLNVLPVNASNGRTWPRVGDPEACHLAPLPDGKWKLAFRPHHIKAGKGEERGLRFRVRVLSTEITGSESFIHLAIGEERWVMLAHGVDAPQTGVLMDVHVEPRHVMTFDDDGAAVRLRQAA